MRVVVTGAAGFIGSHLCEHLLGAGHDVVGIDCFTDYYARALKERNLAEFRSHPRFTFEELDLRVAELDPVLDGADAVVNDAAMPGLVRSWQDFDAYQSCNFSALHRIIEAGQRCGVSRFVQVSTSSVYRANAVGDEEQRTRPVSPYGVTKLAAEHLLAYHQSEGLPVVVLRYFSICGPRQRPDMAYRILCERLLANEPIVVYGEGMQTRGNTYVGDCVAATASALIQGPRRRRVERGRQRGVGAPERGAAALRGARRGAGDRAPLGPAQRPAAHHGQLLPSGARLRLDPRGPRGRRLGRGSHLGPVAAPSAADPSYARRHSHQRRDATTAIERA